VTRVVRRAVEIEQYGGPRDRRGLVNLAVQLTRPRRRPPMHAIQRIARLIGPHTRDAGWILE